MYSCTRYCGCPQHKSNIKEGVIIPVSTTGWWPRAVTLVRGGASDPEFRTLADRLLHATMNLEFWDEWLNRRLRPRFETQNSITNHQRGGGADQRYIPGHWYLRVKCLIIHGPDQMLAPDLNGTWEFPNSESLRCRLRKVAAIVHSLSSYHLWER